MNITTFWEALEWAIFCVCLFGLGFGCGYVYYLSKHKYK